MSSDNPFNDSFDDNPSNNPYSANPDPVFNGGGSGPGGIRLPPGQERGKVGQVNVLGILMAIYGVILGLGGLGVGGYGFALPELIAEAQNNPQFQNNPGFQNNPAFQNNPEAEEVMEVMAIGMFVTGGGLLLSGMFYVFSGISVVKFRRRGLAIVTLSLGLATSLFCYCAPTTIAIAIYGLIVLLDGPVVQAFKLASDGHDANDIRQAFARLP